MILRQISEDATTVTLGWDAVPGSAGYRFKLEDIVKVPHTWDATRTTVRVAKSNLPVTVEALSVVDSGTWPPPAPTSDEGRVSTVFVTGSSTDALLNGFSDADWTWARDHWQRVYAYPPYSDRWMGKMPKAWAYQDSYAIYNPSQYATDHPEQIIKDAAGNKLFIPWGQRPDGSYPQYAADPGNAAWRQNYSDRVKAAAVKGYGLYADDVNLDHVTVSGTPVDPRTGQTMTLSAWDGYFAAFMQKVRADNPGIEIVHNCLWWAGNDGQSSSVQAQIKAATHVSLERGFNDGNYDPGQFTRLFAFIDLIHSWGVGAYHLSYDGSAQGATFNLGCALLVSDGNDFVSSPASLMSPSGWLPILDTDLGAAKGPRYSAGTNKLRRDFARGFVLVDLVAKTATITLT